MRILISAVAITAVVGATPANGQDSSAPPPADRPPPSLELGGWTRASIETRLRFEHDRGALPVPHDTQVGRGLLLVRGRHTRGRTFEATGSALVEGEVFRTEPTLGRAATLHAGARAEVREAYLGVFRSAVDVRVGLQRIAWGHADTFQPNDVANASDLRNPVLNEIELNHIPTFSVRVDAASRLGTLQLVAEPFFARDRYDVYGSNWALIQRDAPKGYRGLLGTLARVPGVSRRDAGEALLLDAASPGGLSGTQGGVRFDWVPGRLDVTHYYHYGFLGTPAFHLDPSLVAALDAVDWDRARPSVIGAQLDAFVGEGAVAAKWERRHHIGLDIGTTVGAFVLRLDAAYQRPAMFYDRTFNAWLSPSLETVVGIEYQTGQIERVILLEGRYRRITREVPEGGLLFASRNAADVAALVRWRWINVLELETRVVTGLNPRSLVARPQIAWRNGRYAVRGGVVLLGGQEWSFGRWYEDNRGVYVMIRRDF